VRGKSEKYTFLKMPFDLSFGYLYGLILGKEGKFPGLS
jgi:hypothetical protein